uniref:Transcription repressor n=1 Tax=Solanum tuberosum TaxID=4113 RepID=M1DXB1_SOLTU
MDSMDPHEEETTSILEVSSSTLPENTNNSTSSNGLEYLPSNDSCVITQMDSNMDAYGGKNRSILEGSKGNSSSSNGFRYYLPFNDSCVIRLSSSEDPYGNIKKSMERMVEANQGIKSWEESLEEICAWYLEINEEINIHKHIIGAFCDLWMIYSGTSTKNTPFGFSSSKPPNPYFMSLIEDKADQIIAASTSSVIP